MAKKNKELEPRMTVTLGYVGYPLDITLSIETNVECDIQEERDMIAAMIRRLAEELAELHPAHEYSPPHVSLPPLAGSSRPK